MAATSHPWPPPSVRRPRWRAGVALACGVLALHAGLLGRLPPAPGAERATGSPRPLQVRQIVPETVATTAPSAGMAADPAAGTAVGTTVPTALPRAGKARPKAAPVPARLRVAAPSTPEGAPDDALAPAAPASSWANAPAPQTADATPPGAAPSTAASEPPDGHAVPVYTTQLPPAATLSFALRRGLRSGQAELTWRPQTGHYELTLQSADFGTQAPGAASRGGFDAAGIAPERFVDRRRGRDQRAVNFQREAGLVTFSGPQQTHALPAGAQDTLSWMLQLPAILQANPALAVPGAQVSMWVAGTRGQADVWSFVVQGTQALELPAGSVAGALLLVRQPLRPYDTQVEVWLDPARHHLPVRTRLSVRPDGGSTEFLLLHAAWP